MNLPVGITTAPTGGERIGRGRKQKEQTDALIGNDTAVVIRVPPECLYRGINRESIKPSIHQCPQPIASARTVVARTKTLDPR